MAKKKAKSEKPVEKPKLRCEEDGTYDWVTATVDCGDVRLDYQATGLKVQGRDGFSEDNLGEWSEDDIKDVAGSMLGIVKEDRKYIEVGYA
jgi:hypothetical protein